jgi:hypothetical protein
MSHEDDQLKARKHSKISLAEACNICLAQAKLFRVRKTVLEMLNDRGYVVKESDLKMTLDDFKYHYARASVDAMYDAHTHCATQSATPRGCCQRERCGSRQDLTMLLRKKAPNDEMCFVFFPEPRRLGVKEVREYVLFPILLSRARCAVQISHAIRRLLQQMWEKQVKNGIFVVQQPLTSFAKRVSQASEWSRTHPFLSSPPCSAFRTRVHHAWRARGRCAHDSVSIRRSFYAL